MASLTPAAAAMSLVLVPLNPFRAKLSMATRRSCRRRSSPGIRGVLRAVGLGAVGTEGLAGSVARARAACISKYSLLFDETIRRRPCREGYRPYVICFFLYVVSDLPRGLSSVPGGL